MTDAAELRDGEEIRPHLAEPGRIAVIGMKPSGPAGSVPRYLARQGFEIVPVNPKYAEVSGRKAYDRVDEIDQSVQIVEIFRRSEVVEEHVDEILAMTPPPELVWFQLGIRNDAAADRLVEAGISVVQDRCMKVDYQDLVGG